MSNGDTRFYAKEEIAVPVAASPNTDNAGSNVSEKEVSSMARTMMIYPSKETKKKL